MTLRRAAQALCAAAVGCASPPAAPPGMVHLQTPGAAGSVADFHIDPYEFPSQPGVKPKVYTNATTAREACAAAGKRLCTAAEWRRACAGPDGASRFGYGAQYEAGRCHVARALGSGHTSIMDPEAEVAASGAHPRCATPEGVFDLVGNAEEWVEDRWRGQTAMLEGGAWYTWTGYADCTGRYSREPDYRLQEGKRVYSAGFRCCWSADPLTEADLTADRDARLPPPADAVYDPAPEVPLGDGAFMDTWEYPNRPGELPVTGLTGLDAAARCAAAGKRLCGSAEWERACAGPSHWAYPYGQRMVARACAVDLEGPRPSGAFLACESPVGARDLVGSVWEWTADTLDAPVLHGRPGEVLQEVRGGAWGVESRKATCRPTDGYPAAPQDTAYPNVGFRCCRGPEAAVPPGAAPGALRCPDGMAALSREGADDYCIDLHEHPNVAGQKPAADLDLPAARAACASAGKHLCTQAEWLHACAGPGRRRWPYGDTYQPDACLDAARAALEGGGGQARPSGSRPSCATPTGVLDLSGNVWEWTAAPGGGGVLMGGGWNLSAGLNQCHSQALAKADHQGQSGARCCASPAEADAILRASP